jgi:geranylgeranyl transferase type-2 subunit beta
LLLQDEEAGGISDRPEDQVDVYHTFFGIAGLSLMGRAGLQPIDPTFALPVEVMQRLRQQHQQGQQPGKQQQEVTQEKECSVSAK